MNRGSPVGTKATTVRWKENIAPGAARFAFGARSLRGRVESVTSHAAATLTAEQADAPPGTDMREFVEALRRNYYAEMPDDAVVEADPEIDPATGTLGGAPRRLPYPEFE